ncbi:protein FAM220A isoform X1 [Suricata suricatta]|uniref:SIPAR domain-containing protein n=1 Tax=Suricata suricatta TaxID=37032 RepID=A0A673UVP1_SURSU|nr:protein FAM220A isoform X1 [Suricata suricatta]XP_029804968.1 protein FAM220A isoform X1 [Suricata suricatta]XP_029804969.1 protein FAM220A isoform X1 [Suricata suricatta]
MRDRVGALGTCLGNVQGAGEDSDKLLCGPEGAQRGSPCPSPWMRAPVVHIDGNSRSEASPAEVKNAQSDVSLSLHDDNKALPCWKESLRSSSACAAARSQTAYPSCAPAGARCAGVACSAGRGWPEGGPGASDSHRGWLRTRELWGSGLPCLQKRSEVGVSEEEPPSALLEGRGSESELSCLRFILSPLLCARPEVFLNDETQWVFFGRSEPAFPEQTEYKKRLLRVQSTSAGLQIPLRLPAPSALRVASRLCHR